MTRPPFDEQAQERFIRFISVPRTAQEIFENEAFCILIKYIYVLDENDVAKRHAAEHFNWISAMHLLEEQAVRSWIARKHLNNT